MAPSSESHSSLRAAVPPYRDRNLPTTPWAVLKSWAPIPIVPDTTAPGQGRQAWEVQGHGMGSEEAKGRVQANSIKSNGGGSPCLTHCGVPNPNDWHTPLTRQ